MINTSAFESLERYNRLNAALRQIQDEPGVHPYYWMKRHITAAMKREKEFMNCWGIKWEKELIQIGSGEVE